MTTRMRLACAAFVCAAATWGIAASADAATYQVWTCTDATSPFAASAPDWTEPSSGSLNNHCPDGLELDDPTNGGMSESGSSYEWQWGGGSTAQVTQLKLTMIGGDTTQGVSYEITGGLPEAVLATLPDRAPGDGDLTTTVSLPPGYASFNVREYCAIGPCSGSAVRFKNIRITLSDPQPPDVQLMSDALSFGADSGTTGAIKWLQPTSMNVFAQAEDYDSGVGEATLQIDGKTVWTSPNTCASPSASYQADPPLIVYDAALICGAYVDAPALADLSGLADGRHSMSFSADDALGQQGQSGVGWFGIDTKPPPAPSSAFLYDRETNPWSTNPIFQVAASDPPPQGDNAAPIHEADASLTRVSDGSVTNLGEVYGLEQRLPGEGAYDLRVWYVDDAGNRGDQIVRRIGYDTTSPPAPTLAAVGGLSRDALVAGRQVTWPQISPPADLESGICGFDVVFDSSPLSHLAGPANVTGNVSSVAIPAGLAEGRDYAHVAAVSCAGVVSNTSTVSIDVDAHAPTVDISGVGNALWSRTPLSVTLDPTDGGSGVAQMHWALDDGPVQTSAGAEQVTIGDGVHVLTAWAVDNAGNVGDAVSQVVQVDTTGPAAWIGSGPGSPNAFTAHVEDGVSGLDSAALQIRRTDASAPDGERQWRQVGAAYLPSNPAGAQSFTRAVDDSSLPDGNYELRVTAVDRAGNIATGATLPAGGSYAIQVPLRARPVAALLVADMQKRCASGAKACASPTRCRSAAHCSFEWAPIAKGAGIDRIVDWGGHKALTGSVRNASGAPLSGVGVKVYSTPRGGAPELVATVTTDAAGGFSWTIPAGPSRNFTAVTAASDAFASATATATEAVRAGVVFSIADRSVRSRQRVAFRGRLAARGLGVPAGGKQISIQYWHDGAWQTFKELNTNSSGSFRWTWRVPVVTGSGSYRFRAVAEAQPTETGWPFEAGKSSPLRVTLRP